MKKVVVASGNVVKLTAAEKAFVKMFPQETFVFEGMTVSSGVADQPMSDEETYEGAKNRVEAIAEQFPDADFWISFEGGVEDSPHGLGAFAWALVRSKDGALGKGRTSTFFLPEAVAQLVRSGVELGLADDQVFGKRDSKKMNGAVGLLTGDVITRTSYYVDAAVLALIPFRNPELY